MVYVMLGTGFEEVEALTPVDLMCRAGIDVKTVGINGKIVSGSHKIGIEADLTLEELDPSDLEMIVLPGGLGGVASIRASEKTLALVRRAYEENRFVAAICAGPTVLADLGITDGKKATCYPGCEGGMGNAKMQKDAAVVREGTVITGTSVGCAVKFALALIEALRGEAAAQEIREQIVIR